MTKRDVLDEELARQLRWRTALPDPIEEARRAWIEREAAVPQRVRDAMARSRLEDEARAGADLARLAAAAWALRPGAEQAKATRELVDALVRADHDAVGLADHGLAALRLWRLLIRHRGAVRRDELLGAADVLFSVPLPIDAPELVELLGEAAEAGDGKLARILQDRLDDRDALSARHPALAARLARVIEAGPSLEAREIAAEWLSFAAEIRDAVPALAAALRLPHAPVRTLALDLLRERAPEALRGDVMQWLLEDAVAHPIPESLGSRGDMAAYHYEEALIRAVRVAPPPRGWEPLLRILEGEGVELLAGGHALDAGWAIRALAAGYPDRALPWVDRALRGRGRLHLLEAVDAAALLPPELARPRLLDAAAGPRAHVTKRAEEAWQRVFGEACPLDPLAVVRVDLLAAPPGERFLARVAILRAAPDDAAAALRVELLGEIAPGADPGAAREALALLLFALRWGSPFHRRPEEPSTPDAWAELLLERLGEPAFEGLAALAEGQARASAEHGWLECLASLARKDRLLPAWRERLQAIAGEWLMSPRYEGETAPLLVLSCVGAEPGMLERLWWVGAEMPIAEGWGKRYTLLYALRWVAAALGPLLDASALDARIAAAGEAALEARDLDRVERLVELGCARGSGAAAALALRAMDGVDRWPAAMDEVARCAYAAQDAGLLPAAWLRSALGAPESLRFSLASKLCRKDDSPELREALEAALVSRARGWASAAEAAIALLVMGVIAVDDARLSDLLLLAPAVPRARLAGLMLRRGAPFEVVRVHMLSVLVSGDEEAASAVLDDLDEMKPEGADLVIKAARAKASAGVQELLRGHLGEPGEADRYWQHRGVGSDEDEDEDDDEPPPGFDRERE